MNDSSVPDSLAALIAERDVLVLSPHMDDAMLSASSVVLDHPCEVWTVFTGAPRPPQTTSWDLSCGFADSDATVAARKDEDARAFAATPARTRHLDALEGAYATREQHRAALPGIEADIDAWMTAHPDGVVIAPACAGLHMPPPVWQPALDAARRVKNAIAARRRAASSAGSAAGEPFGARVVHDDGPPEAPAAERAEPAEPGAAGPLASVKGGVRSAAQRLLHEEHLRRRRRTMGEDGLAANPDHLALRDLTLRVAARHPGVQLVLFEDLPYLWHARGDDEVARLERSSGVGATRVTVPLDVERKHAHLRHYASQLPVLDQRGRLLEAGNLPDHEVFWLVGTLPDVS